MNVDICPHCHARYPEYRHQLTQPIVQLLAHLVRRGGPVRKVDIAMSHSQYTNTQKLRYWGLAFMPSAADGRQMRGVWQATRKGRAFIAGLITIPPAVIVQRNVVKRFVGAPVRCEDVAAPFPNHAHFVEQIRQQLSDIDPSEFTHE